MTNSIPVRYGDQHLGEKQWLFWGYLLPGDSLMPLYFFGSYFFLILGGIFGSLQVAFPNSFSIKLDILLCSFHDSLLCNSQIWCLFIFFSVIDVDLRCAADPEICQFTRSASGRMRAQRSCLGAPYYPRMPCSLQLNS